MSAPTVLVVSKAPVPGRVKTRLAATVGDVAAAELAGYALLDSVAAAEDTGAPVAVAMTGDLDASPMHDEIADALRPHEVIEQRGTDFAERLIGAHADADHGHGVVQIGMDTPHADPAVLRAAAETLRDHDAALGPAHDGGWWLLAVRDARWAEYLHGVPMSTARTGALTRTSLASAGARVGAVPSLRDVDTWDDALRVAAAAPDGRFGACVARIAHSEGIRE